MEKGGRERKFEYYWHLGKVTNNLAIFGLAIFVLHNLVANFGDRYFCPQRDEASVNLSSNLLEHLSYSSPIPDHGDWRYFVCWEGKTHTKY